MLLISGVWLFVVFPFEFACFGDVLPDFLRFLVQWISMHACIGVVATPGVGFGKYGEGYIRFSLIKSIKDIKEACERIAKIQMSH